MTLTRKNLIRSHRTGKAKSKIARDSPEMRTWPGYLSVDGIYVCYFYPVFPRRVVSRICHIDLEHTCDVSR